MTNDNLAYLEYAGVPGCDGEGAELGQTPEGPRRDLAEVAAVQDQLPQVNQVSGDS